MGDLIQFPGMPTGERPDKDFLELEGSMAFPSECTEVVHVFDTVPGYCRCGENHWNPQGTLAVVPPAGA